MIPIKITKAEVFKHRLGDVLLIKFKENFFDDMSISEAKQLFMGHTIEYKDEIYLVKGIEHFAQPASTTINGVGLLIKLN